MSPYDDSDRKNSNNNSHVVNRQNWIIKNAGCPGCEQKLKTILEKEKKIEKVVIKIAARKLQVVYTESIAAETGEKIVSAVASQLGLVLKPDGAKEIKAVSFFDKKSLSYWFVFVVFIMVAFCAWFANKQLSDIILSITVLWGLYPVFKIACFQTYKGMWFGIETLVSIACIGALFLGDYTEAIIVVVLFRLGEYLESIAAGHARKEITSLIELTPKETWVIKNGQRRQIQTSQLKPGDIIQLAPGDRLPADGVLLEPASLDQSILSGESIPVEIQEGEKVCAGALVINPAVSLRVTSEQGYNTVDKILHLIEEADSHRAPLERQIDRFSSRYTPLIIVISLLTILIPPIFFAINWSVSVYQGLAILLIACPCALVISTPAAVTSAIASMACRGGLVKGGAVVENLAQIKKVAFDKTGTLTCGQLFVTGKYNIAEEDNGWFRLAVSVEQRSGHPLAKAIVTAAAEQGVTAVPATSVETIAGKGVSGTVSGHTVLIVSQRFLQEFSIEKEIPGEALRWISEQENTGKTSVVVCIDGNPCGLIAFGDGLREDAQLCVDKLKGMGIESVMLTGDNEMVASHIAKTLNISYEAKLLPEGKVTVLRELKNQGPVMMVGDGINDAPALKTADVGIAMGKGSDTALDVADAALTGERLINLTKIIVIARRARKIIRQNIGCALGFKLTVLCTTLFGLTGLMVAVLADVGATIIVTLNSLRLLNRPAVKRHRNNKR